MNWPCLGKAVGVEEHVSLHWEAESSGCRPGSRIAGHMVFYFHVVRSPTADFRGGCTHLHSHQQLSTTGREPGCLFAGGSP